MTFGAQREDTPVEIRRGEPEAPRVKGNFQLTKNVSRFTSSGYARFERVAAKGHGRWLLC